MVARFLRIAPPLVIAAHSVLACALLERGLLNLNDSEDADQFINYGDINALLRLEEPQHKLSAIPLEQNFILRVGTLFLVPLGGGQLVLCVRLLHEGNLKYEPQHHIIILKRQLVFLSNLVLFIVESVVAGREELEDFNPTSEDWWLSTMQQCSIAIHATGVEAAIQRVRLQVSFLIHDVLIDLSSYTLPWLTSIFSQLHTSLSMLGRLRSLSQSPQVSHPHTEAAHEKMRAVKEQGIHMVGAPHSAERLAQWEDLAAQEALERQRGSLRVILPMSSHGTVGSDEYVGWFSSLDEGKHLRLAAAGTFKYTDWSVEELLERAARYKAGGRKISLKAIARHQAKREALRQAPSASTLGIWPVSLSPLDAIKHLSESTPDTSRFPSHGAKKWKKGASPAGANRALYFLHCLCCHNHAIGDHNPSQHECPDGKKCNDAKDIERTLILSAADILTHEHHSTGLLDIINSSEDFQVATSANYLTQEDAHHITGSSYAFTSLPPVIFLTSERDSENIPHFCRFQALLNLTCASHHPEPPPTPDYLYFQDGFYRMLTDISPEPQFWECIAGQNTRVLERVYCTRSCGECRTVMVNEKNPNALPQHKCPLVSPGRKTNKRTLNYHPSKITHFGDLALFIKLRALHASYFTRDAFHSQLSGHLEDALRFNNSGHT